VQTKAAAVNGISGRFERRKNLKKVVVIIANSGIGKKQRRLQHLVPYSCTNILDEHDLSV
jgi:hypothetical protein